MTSKTLRNGIINAGLAVSAVVVFVVVAEIIAQFVAPPPKPYPLPRGLLVAADGYRALAPNFRGEMDNGIDYTSKRLHIDALGRRMNPAAPTAATEGGRVFVFGDSQSFGQGLEDDETWPYNLQRYIAGLGNTHVAVLNYGVPGTNIGHYRNNLIALADQILSGDTIIVGMTWNDLVSAGGEAEATRIVDGYLVRDETTAAAGKGAIAADKDAEDLRWRFRVFEETGMAVPKFAGIKDFLLRMSRVSALVNFLLPHVRSLYYRVREPVNPYQKVLSQGTPEKNFWLLADMGRRADSAGAKFAVVLLPNRLLVEDAAYETYTQDGTFMSPRNYMAHLALPLCRNFKINCVDTFNVLHRHQTDLLYYRNDGHFTPRAAELVAHAVGKSLASHWTAR